MATSKRRKQTTAGTPNPAKAPEQIVAADSANPAENLAATQPAVSPANSTIDQTPAEHHEAPVAPAPSDMAASEHTIPANDEPAPSSTATFPSANARPAPTSMSPAAERAAFMRRRLIAVAAVALLIAVPAFLANRAFTTPTATAPAPATLADTATPAPAVQPAPTAAPAPAAATNPTAAPAPAAAAACSAIANMPVYAGATCTDQDSDRDDGVVKLENTYVASATADDVRRFYEGAFAQNGWTLGEFKYDINAGQRRVEVEVETDQGANGPITKVQLTEHGAAAPAGSTCAPIAGLPALPNATCVKFDTDRDDGVIKIKNTYSTSESPESVWRLFESALTQSGWAGQAFQYGLQQGLSKLEVKVEAQQSTSGNATTFKIAEK